jgi:putative transposase
MSLHSYSRCWLHLIWATLKRERILTCEAAAKVSRYLSEYAESKGIYLKINYVNDDHAHALIDLPIVYSIEEVAQLFKGSSSHWINENGLVAGKFAWARGYGAFSVSESNVEQVATYIANQEEHHRRKSFMEEYQNFIRRHGSVWREEEENR